MQLEVDLSMSALRDPLPIIFSTTLGRQRTAPNCQRNLAASIER